MNGDITHDDWFSEETATFGDRLAAARDAAGLSQKQLAQHLGVKLSTVRGWEDDLSEPRANKLSMMAGILGVSLSWILTGQGEGLASPDAADPVPSDLRAILIEMRAVRAQITAGTERIARLEKRLKEMLEAGE
ncbi:MAG: helix-turn-helix domain-containing protein [Octadecabacter sp.]|nr:helix-turn-helix domain-containing protein [Octadecabacter sp.]